MSIRSVRSGAVALVLAALSLSACYGNISSPGAGDDDGPGGGDDDDPVNGPLVVSPSQVTLDLDGTQTFRATRSGEDVDGVAWTIEGDPAGGTVTARARLAHLLVPEASYTIRKPFGATVVS